MCIATEVLHFVESTFSRANYSPIHRSPVSNAYNAPCVKYYISLSIKILRLKFLVWYYVVSSFVHLPRAIILFPL